MSNGNFQRRWVTVDGATFDHEVEGYDHVEFLHPDTGEWVPENEPTDSGQGQQKKPFKTPPMPMVPVRKPIPDPVLPSGIRPYVLAVAECAGSSIGTALASVMGSINLVVAADADVQTLAVKPLPTSLYILTVSESGWRKSTAQKLAFEAHKKADIAAHKQWKADRDGDGFLEPDTKVAPVAVRNDSTIEALLKNLADGRRTQGLINPDAGTVFGGWSFKGQQRMQTMARLNQLWDGEPINYERSENRVSVFVDEARFTACLAAQQSIA